MQNCRENNFISCLYTKHACLFDLIIIHSFFWGDMWTTFIIATHLRQLLRQLPTSYREAKPPVTASVWNPLIWCTDNIHTVKHPFLHMHVWSTSRILLKTFILKYRWYISNESVLTLLEAIRCHGFLLRKSHFIQTQ